MQCKPPSNGVNYTSLYGDNVIINNPWSEDLGNWIWRYLSKVATGQRLGHSVYARKKRDSW